ncbi:MAG: secondary thiamine-phosphate synthase enzyme YjbQ [Actinomycetota bacterium]|nr:secondary thiamine-phosphate synthase enzyme YjbQ [Actinomycetota bacterium]
MSLLNVAVRSLPLVVTSSDRRRVVDITADVERIVSEVSVVDGLVCIFCRHTTCGVVINEHEDGLIEDLFRCATDLIPDGYYAHDDLSRRTQNLQGPNEPANGPAHVRQLLFGATSQIVPVVDGRLALGRWQKVLFVEFDTPRPRELLVSLLG